MAQEPQIFRQAEQARVFVQLQSAFTPSAPVQKKELFAGRLGQIVQVISAVTQAGQHVILFGERGVGKTSLASLVFEFLNDIIKDSSMMAPRVNCDANDTFSTIWSKVAAEIELAYVKRGVEFPKDSSPFVDAYKNLLAKRTDANTIRRFFELAGRPFVIIIDEFDRAAMEDTSRSFADTIKTLSDHAVSATLVIVGVADTVDGLIEEHASIDRALIQVLMPRMSHAELCEIVQKGLDSVGMSIVEEALNWIADLARGLPHYAHLLGLHSALRATQGSDLRLRIERADVRAALDIALANAQETIRVAYHRGTSSPHRGNLYKQVLLACALARVDDLGYFAPTHVRDPLSHIMKKRYDIPAFIRHLSVLCSEERGRVLEKTGPERNQRYRFTNPLLIPYILIRGIQESMLEDGRIAGTEHEWE